MKPNNKPDYKRIYTDILNIKYPHKKEICKNILSKEELTVIDIIKINEMIFEASTQTEKCNSQYRSYKESDILYILKYQKDNKLNNTQLANFFKLSRNTIRNWKKRS